MIYRCKNYAIYELVPPELFNEYEEWRLWWLFPETMLRVIDNLRDDYGKIKINDWYWGGENTQSGIRIPGQYYYKLTSQHAWARGFDLHPEETDVETMRRDIIDRKKPYMKFVQGVELDVPWLHIDGRNNGGELFTFSP